MKPRGKNVIKFLEQKVKPLKVLDDGVKCKTNKGLN